MAVIMASLGLSLGVSGQPLTVELIDYTICAGESVSLAPVASGGQPPYNYSWTPASGLSCDDCADPVAAPTATTTYQLTVSDALGEEVTAVSVVSVIPAPIVTFQFSGICDDQLTTVFAFASGGPGPYTYEWSTGFIGAVHPGLAPGTYCVTITNAAGCTGQGCVTVVLPPPLLVQTVTTPASCGSTSDGVLSALSVTGGTPPYAYLWSNGNTAPVNQGLFPGVYTLTITDANGCTTVVAAEIGVELEADAGGPLAVLNCITQDVLLQGSTTSTAPNLSYEWTGPNGFIANTQDALATQEGLYTFKVTDNDQPNCHTTDVIEVAAFEAIAISDMNIELLGCNQYQLSGIIPPNYFGPIDFEWTFPDGSTATTITILANQTGMYTLAISIPGNSCEEAHVARFIDLEAQACATLNGRLVEDADADCAYDDSETGLSGWAISTTAIDGSTFYALTDATGHYSFSLPLGSYIIGYTPPSPLWESCTTSASATLLTAGQEVELNLAARAVEPCAELIAGLSSPFLRRCFSSYYYISVYNAGNAVAVAPTATLRLDPLLTYQSAQLPPASVNGQEISWVFSDLAPGQYYSFWVQVLVSCDAVLGQTHCSELTITPNELCRPAEAGWSGASLRVQGECAGNEVRFRVRNSGSGDLIAPVEYIVVEDAVMMMQAPGVLNTLSSGEEALYTFPANGATYIFRIDQAALHPFDDFSPTAIIEGCGENEQGQFSTGWSNQFPLDPPSPASIVVCIPNQGAYDPNDKQAFPEGYGENHYVEAGDLIRYRLRFQNTGTDTAFTVVIRDELSPWLDISTFQAGGASHNFRAGIEGNRTLVFTFDNIRLPDSTTNLAASQGFVDFAIRIDRNTPLETRVENNAGIYFDFNEPVITNTVFHTVGEDFILVSTWRGPRPETVWKVYPNPTAPYASLQWTHVPEGPKTASLMGADGRVVWRRTFSGTALALDADLAPGVYFLHLQDEAGSSLGVGRLVVVQ